VVIISQEISKEGIIEILDWFNRDGETRGDIHMLISKEKNAKEIISAKSPTEEVMSFFLDDAIMNEKNLSNAPNIELLQFSNVLTEKGVGSIATAVGLEQQNGQKYAHVMGTAIFKGDKLIGFINGDDTKNLLFVQNHIKGGVLVVEEKETDFTTPASLEIFKNKTKIEPVVTNENVRFNIKIVTTVSIDEIGSTVNITEDNELKRFEEAVEKSLENKVENTIRKVQSEYGVDIFGFGAVLRQNKPKLWNNISDRWDDVFKNSDVNVEVKIHIKNSAMLSKPMEISD
jgi:spore germination protein KC